jgi:hypothetical protein
VCDEVFKHARNNMRLYNISERDISETIDLPEIIDREGIKMITIKKIQNRFSGYPLKVVYEKRENELFIITTYPLKKKLWR